MCLGTPPPNFVPDLTCSTWFKDTFYVKLMEQESSLSIISINFTKCVSLNHFLRNYNFCEIHLGFTVENVVENVCMRGKLSIQTHNTLVFDDIFDSKSKISPWWLAFQKKYGIHEKCGRASRIQHILAKVLEMKPSLSKSTKTTEKLCILFTV